MMLHMEFMIQTDRIGMTDRKTIWKDGEKDVTA